MTFTDTGARPMLHYLGETGNSGLLTGGGKPLPGWCSISVDTGKLVFYLDGLGSKTVDLRAAEMVGLGALKTDSGGFTLQMFSPPFAHNGAVCCFVTHFRGTWQGGSANDNTRDLFLLATPFAVGTQDDPVDPPAPPGATGDIALIVRAIEAARGPLDGRDAPDNSVAGVKNTANAIYDRLGLRAGDKTMGALLTELRQAVEGGAGPDFRTPAWEDDGLPPELVANLGSQWQRDMAFTVITLLEYLLRLDAFPRPDGGTILRT